MPCVLGTERQLHFVKHLYTLSIDKVPNGSYERSESFSTLIIMLKMQFHYLTPRRSAAKASWFIFIPAIISLIPEGT